MEKKLYIGGIPGDMDELSLAQLIGGHGDIATLKIVRDKLTKKGKGYAFVEMVSDEGMAAAVGALNGLAYREKILEVKPADIKEDVVQPIRYERVRKKMEPEKKLRPRRPRL